MSEVAQSGALAAIRAVDAGGQLDDVLAMPDHLRDALWRIETARLEPQDSPGGVVLCGMGGSAVGGDLALAALGDRVSRPVTVVRGYQLAPWTSTGSTVLCSSYSGSTEETLSCYAAAEALGARRIVATTGGELAEAARRDGVPVVGLPAGLQPRAAVAYMLAVAAEAIALAGAGPRIHTEFDSSIAHLSERAGDLAERSAELADRLAESTPVIYGADLTSPVAFRWKTQINENAKLPAFWAELPEADHNELVGWDGAAEAGRFSAVFLADPDQHPRERRRIELTARLVEPHAAAVETVEAEGATRAERLLWTVMLGDLVSLQLAARRGLDPSPVEVIDRLKQELAKQ